MTDRRQGSLVRSAGRRKKVTRGVAGVKARLHGMESLERRLCLSTIGPFARIVQPTAVLGGPETRVVGGTATDEFRSVGIVGDRLGGFCSGTLVSPVHVATAAHCAVGMDDQDGRFSVEGITYDTRAIHVHPRYNDFTLENDIAIFHLRQPVTQVIPSPLFRGVPRVGQVLTLVGYGAGGTGDTGHNGDFGTKRVGLTPIDGVEEKLITWRFDDASESNTAPGDSGGAAFLQQGDTYYLAGITSGGDRWDAGFGDNSFDTRVDTFADWIDDTSEQATVDAGDDAVAEQEMGEEVVEDSDDAVVDDTLTEELPADGSQPEDTTVVEDPVKPEPPSVTEDDHVDVVGPEATELVFVDGSASFQGVLEIAGDRDVFQVVLAEDGTAVIQVSSIDGRLDTYLRVYDETGGLIAENDDFAGRFDSQVELDLPAGRYFVDVGAYADWGLGAYDVQVEMIETTEAPSVDAEVIELNSQGVTRLPGEISEPGEVRSYTFVAVQTGRMTVRTNRLSAGMDTTLTAYDAQGNELAFNDDWRGLRSRVRWSVEAGETYRVDVAGYRDSTGSYRLALKTRESSGFWSVPGIDDVSTELPGQVVETVIDEVTEVVADPVDTLGSVFDPAADQAVWNGAEQWMPAAGQWGWHVASDVVDPVDSVLDLEVDWLGWLDPVWF